jgi:hypothetical protein
MKTIRVAVPLAIVAIVSFGAALAAAPPGEIVATGTVVSLEKDQIVVRTADHGHRISFALDAKSELPEGLAKGNQVKVVYHATGSTGQTADRISLVEGKARVAEKAPAPTP